MITGLYSVRASHFRSLCFEAHDVLVVSSVIHRYPQAVPGRSGRSLRSRDWLRTPPSQPARQTLSVPCGRCRHYRLVVSESPPPRLDSPGEFARRIEVPGISIRNIVTVFLKLAVVVAVLRGLSGYRDRSFAASDVPLSAACRRFDVQENG